MRRFITIMCLILGCVMLWSCGNATVPGEETKSGESQASETGSDATETNEDDGIPLLNADGSFAFQPVRSDSSSDNVTSAVVRICQTIREKYSVKTCNPKTDFVERGKEVPSGAGELLIGSTNRQLSIDLNATLKENEYAIIYKDGAILIAGSGERALTTAINVFITDVLGSGKKTISENLEIRGVYQLVDLLKEENDVLPCARYQAKELFQIDAKGGTEGVVLATLQGLVANLGSQQIIQKSGGYNNFQPFIKEQGVEVSTSDANGKTWTTASLLAFFAPKLEGYILCDSEQSSESVAVAISLSGLFNAVAVPALHRQWAEDAGLTCVLDVTGKGDSWLRSSEYWNKLSRVVAVEQVASSYPRLVDYAAMAGAYISFYDGHEKSEHAAKYKFLNKGGIVLGFNNTLGEFDTVDSFGGVNLQMIPADHAFNISTYSGFAAKEMQQPNADNADGEVTEKVHTVTFIMSDGDNMQWFVNDLTTSGKYYGSLLRGSFPINWGIPTTAAYLTQPALAYVYGKASTEDYFIAALSGIGYTFPSRWNTDALDEMAVQTAQAMKDAGVKYLEVLDDHGFDNKTLSSFLIQDEIEGVFYIDYGNYAQFNGQILWVNRKPAVSARYRLWADAKGGSVDEIANAINKASTDPTSASAYSFVIVHAWSGLDESGNLVSGGSPMAAVQAVIDKLDSDVDVVTADEFMERIITNVKH